MSETKIQSKQPSIQTLELQPEGGATLTESDIKRLFKGSPRPKFDIQDIKTQNCLAKREKGQFFITMLEKWNNKIDECQSFSTNSRTEFLMIEFIYSSMKRMSMMADHDVDKQLLMLYNWFMGQTKNSSGLLATSMPTKKHQNEYYNVTKTFKTNPTTIIQEYIRPKCFLGSVNKLQSNPTQEQSDILSKQLRLKPLKQCLNGNFITSYAQKKVNTVFGGSRDLNIPQRCSFEKLQNQKRHEQLRNYLQKKEIQLQEWNFKIKKGRLLSQNTKNYFIGNFNSIQRLIKTSSGERINQKNEIIDSLKKMRIHTSFGNRVLRSKNQKNQNYNPLITDINNFGLLSNPFEIKIKKKKTKAKGTKK